MTGGISTTNNGLSKLCSGLFAVKLKDSLTNFGNKFEATKNANKPESNVDK